MRFKILLVPEAIEDLESLPAHVRRGVRDALEIHLRHEPTKVSKSRIKRLREMTTPQYRLRVGEIRVFYDVIEPEVRILAVVAKSQASDWLNQFGEPE